MVLKRPVQSCCVGISLKLYKYIGMFGWDDTLFNHASMDPVFDSSRVALLKLCLDGASVE